MVKNPPASAGDTESIPGSGRSQEEEMATHSSVLAWEIPWTESQVGYSLWGHKESDTTEVTSHTHYHDSYSKNWEANQGDTVTGKG